MASMSRRVVLTRTPHRREPLATTDDVYRILGTVVSLLERQNQMIYNIGQNAVENEEFWHKQNRNY